MGLYYRLFVDTLVSKKKKRIVLPDLFFSLLTYVSTTLSCHTSRKKRASKLTSSNPTIGIF